MSNQRNESSFAGKARITTDKDFGGNIIFDDVAAAQVKTLYLDAASAHAVEISLSAQADLSIRATKSSPDAISKGRAIWGAASAYSDRDGDLFLGDVAAGVTAIEVTLTRNAAGNAAEMAAIGGFGEVRATKIAAVTSGETALFATTRTEMAVDA